MDDVRKPETDWSRSYENPCGCRGELCDVHAVEREIRAGAMVVTKIELTENARIEGDPRENRLPLWARQKLRQLRTLLYEPLTAEHTKP